MGVPNSGLTCCITVPPHQVLPRCKEYLSSPKQVVRGREEGTLKWKLVCKRGWGNKGVSRARSCGCVWGRVDQGALSQALIPWSCGSARWPCLFSFETAFWRKTSQLTLDPGAAERFLWCQKAVGPVSTDVAEDSEKASSLSPSQQHCW